MVPGKIESSKGEPFVSVVTPFFNAERYLQQCIESVLTQTYRNYEYILVNNQSTDASRSICEHYAQRDCRIRLLDTPKFLKQIENFEGALKRISPTSRYCKMVLADDWLFPDCITRMVEVAEANPSVGIVSSYQLFGDTINGSGMPYPSTVISGREACRLMLLYGYYLTGSPTSILVRSEIIRGANPFYPSEWIHEDTEACFQVLAQHDFGFVHQVLTFSRSDPASLSSIVGAFNPGPLRKFMFAKKYGPRFLTENESRKHLRNSIDRYGSFLAESLFEFKNREFWNFHRRGLRAMNCTFWDVQLPKYVFLEVLDIALNLKKTAGRLIRAAKTLAGKQPRKRSSGSASAKSDARLIENG
jgi:glycosyltransferase involved in cell wall biosynthesis